jgi:hypothetical protein
MKSTIMGVADEETWGREGHFHSADDLNYYTGVGGKLNYNHSSLKSPPTHLISSHKVAKLVSSGTEEVASLLPASELNSELPERLVNSLRDGETGLLNHVALGLGNRLPVRCIGVSMSMIVRRWGFTSGRCYIERLQV